MADLHNVIVFALDGVRLATELRWVREVTTLGFVTEVPTAPAGVVGVCNLHGSIVPVLDIGALRGGRPGQPARQGDGALVVELDGVLAALRVDQVDEVATLRAAGDAVVDRRGERLALLDPRELLRIAVDAVTAAGEASAGRPGLDPTERP